MCDLNFFCILLSEDVPEFNNVTEVKEGVPWNLYYMWVKRQLLVKDNTQFPDNGAGGQGYAIQINDVVG